MCMDGMPTKLFPLEFVPRMCHSLGISLDETVWAEQLQTTSRSKRLVEIQRPVQSASSTGSQDISASPVLRPSPSNNVSLCSSRSRSMCEQQSSLASAASGTSFDRENEELRKENAQLKRRLENASKKMKAKDSKIRRLAGAVAKQKAKAKAKPGLDSRNSMDVTKTAKNRNLTVSGSLAIGLRMALTSCSALTFPRAAWVDISRITVSRCEVKLAGTIFVRAQVLGHLIFHRLSYSRMLRKGPWACSDNFLAAANHLARLKSCKPYLAEIINLLKGRNADQEGDDSCCAISADEGEAYDPQLEELPSKVNTLLEGLHAVVGLPPPSKNEETTLCISGLSLQNDATNSEIWHKKKLTSMVIEASTLVNVEMLCKQKYNDAFFSDQFLLLGSFLFCRNCCNHQMLQGTITL